MFKLRSAPALLVFLALAPSVRGELWEYADTTGFTIAAFPSSSTQAFAFPGNGGPITMSRTTTVGTGLSLEERVVTYSGSTPFDNPAWVAGTRSFYGIRHGSSGTAPVITITGTFSSPLPTTGYMVFTDVEFGEQITVKAYNGSSLVPFGDLTFTRWNGASSSGTSVNTTWNTGTGVSGILISGTPYGFSNPVVTLQSAQPVSSFEYTIDMGELNNSLGFNFAVEVVPEPATVALAAVAGITATTLRLRRRRRIR